MEARPESSWARATWPLVYYIVVPTTVISVIMWRFPELDSEKFAEMLRWVLVIGVFLVGVAALRADYAVGTNPRLVLDVTYVALAITWVLGILGGGTVLEQSWQGHVFFVDIERLFIIVTVLASLNVIYYALQYAQAKGLISSDSEDEKERHPVTIEYIDDSPAT
jgi:hypothetical protein